MALKDVIKKGTAAPLAGDLIVGGIGIDVSAKKLYIKNADNSITIPNQSLFEAKDTTIVKSASSIADLWTGTQAQYNAVSSKLATTLYFIQD